MIRIRETLLPDHIVLDLIACSRDEAVQQLVGSLRSDTRVTDWPRIRSRVTDARCGRESETRVRHSHTACSHRGRDKDGHDVWTA